MATTAGNGVGQALERGGPLARVRVVDLTGDIGRFATKVLAELGADVVRLRPGDAGPPMLDVNGGLLDWWFDGGTTLLEGGPTAGPDVLRALIAHADVLIESEGPGRLAMLGLGPDDLRALNPRLAHVTLTPWGIDGPRAQWQSSDLVMSAASGLLSVNGHPDEPVVIWGHQMDNIAGFYAAICALTGVFRARTTGRGTRFDLSQQQAAVSCTEHLLMFWWYPEGLAAFGAPKAVRQASLHWIRGYEVVECARGYCMVSPSAGGVPRLVEWMTELGHAPVLPPPVVTGADVARIDALMSALHGFARDLDATDLFHGGQSRHVPFGEVLTVPQVAECPQHVARGFFRRVIGAPAAVRMPGPLARFSATPSPPAAAPPTAAVPAGEASGRWVADQTEGSIPQGEPAALPLAGIRVIDFTHVLAGPFATRVLADLGAHVVKIQTEVRTVGSSANDFPYAGMWNRSKDSVTLNMAIAESLGVLRRLVEQADVLIENFSAGVLEEWGAGWEVLHEWNPRLIYLSMQGVGSDGPWRDFVTFAPTVHALCGLTALTGPEGRMDCGPGVALNDHMSGLAGAVALLAALEARWRTGVGQHVDLSQFEVGTYLVGPALLDWFANGRDATASGNRDPFTDPVPNEVVPSGDGGWLAVTARDDHDWQSLAMVIGAGGHLATVDERRIHREEVRGLLADWAAGHTADAASERLQAVGVPAHAVHDAEALTTTDPQLAHRDWLVSMESPIWGTQMTDRFPAIVSDASGEELQLDYRHTPYLGEHTFEVLEALLGLDATAVAEGMGRGVFN